MKSITNLPQGGATQTYTLTSTGTTSIPSDIDGVVIYSGVLPAGTYIASIKLYLNYSVTEGENPYNYYIRCNNMIRVQRPAPAAYETLSGVITSDGTNPTVIALYQNSGATQERPYTYDTVNFVKLS